MLQDARDTITDVIGGRIDIAFDIELDADARTLIATIGLDLEDAFDTRNTIFDDLRDLVLDDVGRGSAISRLYRNDRAVDVGILAQRQSVERDKSKNNEQRT